MNPGTSVHPHHFPQNKPCIIEFAGVTRTYDAGHVFALQDVTLAVGRGEFLAVVGPSGSGKTTLLNLMSGLDRPSRGSVFLNGAEPQNPHEWARLRSREIGFVFQSFELLPGFTALENVQIPMFGVTKSPAKRLKRAWELLDRVDLAAKIDRRPDELSSGEKQRVAIARSLANSPSILLADEPTGNLDSRSSEAVMTLLRDLWKDKGLTLVVVTHNPAIAKNADRTVEFLDGRIASIIEGNGS